MNPLSIVWNVDPVLFSIGSIEVRYYGLTWAMAIGFGLYLFTKFCRHEKLNEELADSAFWYISLGTLIGARLGHCLFYDFDYYICHPLEILNTRQGGMASHGAALGMIVGLWLFARKNRMPYLWGLDRVAIAATIGGAFVRFGNLMNSEIYGEPTDLIVPQCLFGLHLASPPDLSRREGAADIADSRSPLCGRGVGEASLCLVESEKTALIMSLIKPDTVWLATGGKANFKESMLWPLLGHEIAVYPDADALRDWELRIHQLNSELGHRLYIPTGYYNLMDHEEPRSKGWDLVDVILSEELRVKSWAPRCTHS